jgi:neutral trehalase
VIVRRPDYTREDHTLLLPLWAGVPGAQQAQGMLSRNVLNAERFDRPFGIPACQTAPNVEADSVCSSVYLPWNLLIGEGMLAYGFRQEAARLVAHLMAGVIINLSQKRAFYQRYHAETGQGLGERDALSGLAPVGLFLQVLGVKVLSATRVRLVGKNPFPWPVTVYFKGLKVKRGLERTEVIFPNGKSALVDDPAPCIVAL